MINLLAAGMALHAALTPVAGLASMAREAYYARGFGMTDSQFRAKVQGCHVAHLSADTTMTTSAGSWLYPAGTAVFAGPNGLAYLSDIGQVITSWSTLTYHGLAGPFSAPGDTTRQPWDHVVTLGGTGGAGGWPLSPALSTLNRPAGSQ